MTPDSRSSKKGVLLVNLGTPENPSVGAVKKYLREFLSDPYVIDIPFFFRWILVNGLICPFRSPKSAAAYQKIWTQEGSPLRVHTETLTLKVAQKLGDDFSVHFAMRYGSPSIDSVISGMLAENLQEWIILPLYPQYALSSTESSIDRIFRVLHSHKKIPSMKFAKPFFADDGYLSVFRNRGQAFLMEKRIDHVLFSFHGLPVRHLRKLYTGNGCYHEDASCCRQITMENEKCYRAQCFETARLLAKKLSLPPERYTLCFQSRLGRDEWIAPNTEAVIAARAVQGDKRLLVFSPSFVADCLETLEEIQIRAREFFVEKGGEELFLVPSLNSGDDWVEAVEGIIRKTLLLS